MKQIEIIEIKAITTDSELSDALDGHTILSIGKLLERSLKWQRFYEEQGYTISANNETTFTATKIHEVEDE